MLDGRRFLVTGASGNLGFCVLQKLLLETDSRVTALVRPRGTPFLHWQLRDAGVPEFPSRLAVLEHSLGSGGSGLPLADLYDVTDIVHCAANVRWRAAPDDLFAANVEAIDDIVLAAQEIAHRTRNINRVSIVSTAYVRPHSDGARPRSATAYEVTKLLGERLARQAVVPVTVVRPSTIVGDSRSGRIESFTGAYFLFRILSAVHVSMFPGNAAALVDIVPVDFVAQEIISIHCCANPPPLVTTSLGASASRIEDVWRAACVVLDRLAPLARRRQAGTFLSAPIISRLLKYAGSTTGNKRLLDIAAYTPYLEQTEALASQWLANSSPRQFPELEPLLTTIVGYALSVGFHSSKRRFSNVAA